MSRNFFGLSLVKLNKLNNEELMELVQNDNQKAFELLYKRNWKAVMNYMSNMVYDKTKVEELVQEAFFKAYRHRSQFEVGRKFKPWFWTIARNTTLDHLRKKSDLLIDDIFKGIDGSDFTSTIEDESDGAEELLIQNADSQKVHNILNKLPTAQKEILSLAALSELSYEEICQLTGKSLSSVKSVLFRARKKFADEFNKAED